MEKMEGRESSETGDPLGFGVDSILFYFLGCIRNYRFNV